MTRPVAFYAPLKSPDHPAPSGDRSAGRLLLKALSRAGYAPTLASSLRAYEPAGHAARQAAIRDEAGREATRLISAFRAMPPGERPRLWFTYHCYYKAPDWIGPAVAEALAIPYIVAEGSRARKRAGGPWAFAHAGAAAALDRAEILFAATDLDAEALRRDRLPHQRVVDLPPFLDVDDWPPLRRKPSGSALRLLAVGMMRDGDKLASYRLLADALAPTRHSPLRHPEEPPRWTLDIVGGGPSRAEVAVAFASLADQVTFHGEVADRARLAALYAEADLLVWPAVNEAYGMALLEAQAMGCPVLAGRYGGVASVVRDGVTGLLVAPGDVDAFATALSGLLRNRSRLEALGTAAAAFVRGERHLDAAAATLRTTLAALGTENLAA